MGTGLVRGPDESRDTRFRARQSAPGMNRFGATERGQNPMNASNLDQWLERYGRAWADRNPLAAKGLFSPGAEYHETPFDPPFIGREAIGEYWADVPRSQADITFQSRVLAVFDRTGIAHWHAAFTRVPSGRRVELDGVFVLTFDEGGSCTELREWWHRRESAGATPSPD
jgi:hypothetical protein